MSLVGQAAGVAAKRREHRLAALRLAGAAQAQVLVLSAVEQAVLAFFGAVAGLIAYSVLSPLVLLVIGPIMLAVIGTRGAVLPIVIGVAMAALAVRVVGPWAVQVIGKILARTAKGPVGLLAGRRLADDPKGAFRPVAVLVLSGFVTGSAGLRGLSPRGVGVARLVGTGSPTLSSVSIREVGSVAVSRYGKWEMEWPGAQRRVARPQEEAEFCIGDDRYIGHPRYRIVLRSWAPGRASRGTSPVWKSPEGRPDRWPRCTKSDAARRPSSTSYSQNPFQPRR